MTTQINFVPSTTAPFTFQATLDRGSYTGVVRWNIFGQRYYLELFSVTGERILTLALVGSPPGYDISLTAGYFATKIVYRPLTNQLEVG